MKTVECRKCHNVIEDPKIRISPNDPERKGIFNEIDTEIWCPNCQEWTWAGEAWQWISLED